MLHFPFLEISELVAFIHNINRLFTLARVSAELPPLALVDLSFKFQPRVKSSKPMKTKTRRTRLTLIGNSAPVRMATTTAQQGGHH